LRIWHQEALTWQKGYEDLLEEVRASQGQFQAKLDELEKTLNAERVQRKREDLLWKIGMFTFGYIVAR